MRQGTQPPPRPRPHPPSDPPPRPRPEDESNPDGTGEHEDDETPARPRPVHPDLRRARTTRATRLLFLAAATLGLAATARAETLLSGSAGLAFAGRTDDSKATYGGTLTFKGPVFGVAVDFGYTPDFFGTTGFGNNNLVTLMGNLVVSSPGPVRVYGTAGLGLVKSKVEDVDGFFSVDSNELGINAGAGILVFPRDGRVGFHADLRYFRNLTDPERDDEFDVDLGDLDYWRGEAGITIRF